MKFRNLIYTLLIIAISLYPRLWHLKEYPPVIVDEPANLRDIQKIIDSKEIHITDFHWDFSKSIVVHIPVIIVSNITGQRPSIYTLRLTSVVLSIATLIAFFFIIKDLMGDLVAFLTTMLLSSSYFFLQFSRVGWTDIILSLFLGTTLFLTLEKEETQNNHFLLLFAGSCSGILLYSYRAGLVFIGVSLLYFLPKGFKKTNLKNLLKKLSIYAITTIIISTPWILKISKKWEQYNLRQKVVSIKNVKMPYHGKTNYREILFYQITTSFKSWILLQAWIVDYQPENSRYLPLLYPPVNLFIRIFFWLGLLVSISRKRDLKKFGIWILIIVFTIAFGQVLTVEPPNGARALVMLPAIYVIFGLGVNSFLNFFKQSKLAKASIIFLSLAYAISDIKFYQYWMTWIKV